MTVFTKKQNLKTLLAGFALATLFTAASVSADTYTVQAGDTLSQIANTANTTVEQIAQLNQLEDVNLIYVGQVLELSAEENTASATVETVETVETAEVTAEVAAQTSYSSDLSADEVAAKEIIAFRESSGSYTAQNGQYYGRYQLSLSYLNGDLSPENQERVADAYVAERYGSWSAALAFWNNNGWY